MKIFKTAFDHFLVWRFVLDKGETKEFNKKEMDRNLEAPASIRATAENLPYPVDKLVTLNSIAVFVHGQFYFHKDGHEPTLKMRGDGGDSVALGTEVNHFSLHSMEDNSEYHCILPRDRRPRFWPRKLTHLIPGTLDYVEIPGTEKLNQYIYLAHGEVQINGKRHIGHKFMTIPFGTGARHIKAITDSLVLRIWLNQEDFNATQ